MRKILLFIFVLTCTARLTAQQAADTSLQLREDAIRHLYDQQRGNELALFNGVQHYPYPTGIDGIAYFRQEAWRKGFVVFEGIRYDDIFMKYDLVKDQLIVAPYEDGGLFVGLYSPRVQEFSFDGSRFVRLDKKSNADVSEGFYQVLAQGRVTSYARTSKVIEEKVESSGVIRWFEQKVRYYILKDGKYYRVGSKNDLLSILKEHKREIQSYLSKNKMKYRKQTEAVITAATEIYNQSN